VPPRQWTAHSSRPHDQSQGHIGLKTRLFDLNADTRNQDPRPIRSFVIRAGRLTDSQRLALRQHWDEYVFDYKSGVLDLDAVFPRPAPVNLEIGFGMGDSLLAMARENPASNFLGIEVHKPGIGKLLNGLAREQIDNVRILCRDAREVLQNCIVPNSLARVLLLFPDPWPKKKHHKRRLVQPDFVELVASRLQPAGRFHLATDWENYAEQMLEVLEANSALKNTQGPGRFWSNPDRPETKFERRGQRLGHEVRDLLYEKLG